VRRVLLVEPAHRGRFPPLGLMKLSTYHKRRGEQVSFVRGCDPQLASQRWDRVYVSSLFTYTWAVTVRTIQYYMRCVEEPSQTVVGGVLATLMGDELREATGVRIVRGLLDTPGELDRGDHTCIDTLMPDYGLLDEVDFDYDPSDAYITYATRGCPNHCDFCAVNQLEPEFVEYVPIRPQVKRVNRVFGPRQHLVLLDNNVLASSALERIIGDIEDLGFHRGAKFDGRIRKVDFNQGLDLRRFDARAASLLSRIAIKPIRLAFDWLSLKKQFRERVAIAVDHGLTTISTYVLYNYRDTPADFYQRLRIGVELGRQHGIQLSSFPMKYVPLDAKDRSYVGPHWNRRLLRGVQCILLATRGMVGTKLDFFEAAFGATPEEFIEIAMMPDDYIIFRRDNADNGAAEWRKDYRRLTANQLETFTEIIGPNRRLDPAIFGRRMTKRVRRLLEHYPVRSDGR